MASAKLYLDTRKVLKGGFYPLRISAATHGKNFLVTLQKKIRLLPAQWDGVNITNHSQALLLNAYAKEQLVLVKNLLFELEASLKLDGMPFEEVREKARALLKKHPVKEKKVVKQEHPYTVAAHYADFKARKKGILKKRTLELYDLTFKKIAAYADIKTLTFKDINSVWLNNFNGHLSMTADVNARAIDMRNLRAIFNDAINNTDKVSLNDYPFRAFTIKKRKTIKRSLSVEQLFYLKNLSWQHYQECADFLMLSFYLIGINIIDILHLTPQSLSGGKIAYYRAKTGRLYEYAVLPEALSIINKYRGQTYLLCWRERYADYTGFTKYVDKRCHNIGEIIGVPALTTYYMRHSWATIAAYLDIPKETIAAALGHGGDTVTDIYINFDTKKIDAANKAVIGYLNNYIET